MQKVYKKCGWNYLLNFRIWTFIWIFFKHFLKSSFSTSTKLQLIQHIQTFPSLNLLLNFSRSTLSILDHDLINVRWKSKGFFPPFLSRSISQIEYSFHPEHHHHLNRKWIKKNIYKTPPVEISTNWIEMLRILMALKVWKDFSLLKHK